MSAGSQGGGLAPQPGPLQTAQGAVQSAQGAIHIAQGAGKKVFLVQPASNGRFTVLPAQPEQGDTGIQNVLVKSL